MTRGATYLRAGVQGAFDAARPRRGEGIAGIYLAQLAALSTALLACESDDTPKTAPPKAQLSAHRAPSPPPKLSPQPRELVNLLALSTRLVTVSSHRDELSLGQFVIDGRSDTAWRPNPPDPEPWLEVAFTQQVDITRLSLTREKGTTDSAASQVVLRLEADGNIVKKLKSTDSGHFTAHWDKPVSTKGLRLTLEAKGKKEQLAFDTLTIEGPAPPTAMMAEKLPETRVQGARRFALTYPAKLGDWWRQAPFENEQQLCASYEQATASIRPRLMAAQACTIGAPIAAKGEQPEHVKSLRWLTLAYDDDPDSGSASALVVETQSGLSLTAMTPGAGAYAMGCPGMPTGGDSKIELNWQEGFLIAKQIRWFHPNRYHQTDPPAAAIRALRICDVRQGLQCREYLTAFGLPHERVMPEQYEVLSEAPREWTWEREFELSSDGMLRFSPCTAPGSGDSAKGKEVPCLAPGYSTLL